MGARSSLIATAATLGLAACPQARPAVAPRPVNVADAVVADFEAAVKANKDAYVALFDFSAVGEYEILLHRYDLNGRLKNLPDDQKVQFAGEDGTPYPAARERKNVGNFYTFLAQRTVGTGGCTRSEPRTHYGKLLGTSFEPLPAGTPAGYEVLRTHANEWLTHGGVIGLQCSGGKGGLALIYTTRDSVRGYDLITIYDD